MRSDFDSSLPSEYNDSNQLRVLRKYQVRDLVGQLLTYVDATYQDPEQRQAHKDIVRHTTYKWFTEQKWAPDKLEAQFDKAIEKVMEDFAKEHKIYEVNEILEIN